MPVQIKWAYEKPSASDGVRILVDGLWPRGQSKEKLKIAEWMRDIAPSAALRKWYGHKIEKWEAFRKKYREELKKQPRRALLDELIRPPNPHHGDGDALLAEQFEHTASIPAGKDVIFQRHQNIGRAPEKLGRGRINGQARFED